MDLGDVNGDGLPDPVVIDSAAGLGEILLNTTRFIPAPVSAAVAGSSVTASPFVNVQVGQVSGRAFDDLDQTGIERTTRPGQAGNTVYIDINGNGRLDPGEPSAVTSSDGYYSFSGLPSGTYEVRLVPEPGRRLTTPGNGTYTVTVAPGQPAADVNFGSVSGVDAQLQLPAQIRPGQVYGFGAMEAVSMSSIARSGPWQAIRSPT